MRRKSLADQRNEAHRFLKKLTTIAVVLGIAGFITYGLMFGAKKIAEGISYRIVGFGIPQISGATLTLPLTLKIINATPVPIPIDSLVVNLSFLQNGQYMQAGQLAKGGFTVTPGEQDVVITPTINLKNVFTNVWDTIRTAINGMRFSIKADIQIAALGVVTTDTVYKDFTL